MYYQLTTSQYQLVRHYILKVIFGILVPFVKACFFFVAGFCVDKKQSDGTKSRFYYTEMCAHTIIQYVLQMSASGIDAWYQISLVFLLYTSWSKRTQGGGGGGEDSYFGCTELCLLIHSLLSDGLQLMFSKQI